MRGARMLRRWSGTVALLIGALAQPAWAQHDTIPPSAHPATTVDAPPHGATVLQLHLADGPDAAFQRLVNLLEAVGYRLDHVAPDDGTLTTRFRYLKGTGLVQLSAAVHPDSGDAAVIHLSGDVRRLRNAVVFSMLGPIERVTYGERTIRQQTAWNIMADLGRRLGPRRITYGRSP